MTKKKQVKSLVAAIEKQYSHWQRMMDEYADGGEFPTLASLVQDQIHSLRGYSKKLATQYEWMLAI